MNLWDIRLALYDFVLNVCQSHDSAFFGTPHRTQDIIDADSRYDQTRIMGEDQKYVEIRHIGFSDDRDRFDEWTCAMDGQRVILFQVRVQYFFDESANSQRTFDNLVFSNQSPKGILNALKCAGSLCVENVQLNICDTHDWVVGITELINNTHDKAHEAIFTVGIAADVC